MRRPVTDELEDANADEDDAEDVDEADADAEAEDVTGIAGVATDAVDRTALTYATDGESTCSMCARG